MAARHAERGRVAALPDAARLADKAVAAFKDKQVERLLDACAGAGALADAWARLADDSRRYGRRESLGIDAVEIDARHHPALREKGYDVVGFDFLAFEGGSIYSHVLVNPPFVQGAKHVLKAWDMLWCGEVVAILNAETLRNAHSVERRRLLSLVEKHGSVEFIADAFRGLDVEREADVEVALVHLVKPAACAEDWIGPVIEALSIDREVEGDFRLPTELALPASFVENQCRVFRLALKAMRVAVRGNAVAKHFVLRIGATMAERQDGRDSTTDEDGAEAVRGELRSNYLELKDRAWTSVLRSTETLQRLSRKVQQQAESQFATIKALEFTESNVYGFLLGLVESQPEMQVDMMCDVFDQITRYHSDNAVFYRGWKSNDRHRTCGMRIKTTRFILPGHGSASYSSGPSWDSVQMLADFDKVFALLDGKRRPEVGLIDVFKTHWDELRGGERVASDYFDVRYYRRAGTIHFFARSAPLVDRLNRMVGARRAWLPPATAAATEAFWKQYERAEQLDREVRTAIAEVRRERVNGGWLSTYDDPIRDAFLHESERSSEARAVLSIAVDRVLAKHKLLDALTREAPCPLMLPCATGAGDASATGSLIEAAEAAE